MTLEFDLPGIRPEALRQLDSEEARAVISTWIEGGFRVMHRLHHDNGRALLLEPLCRPAPRREREVLRRASLGGSGKVIALEFGLSFSTVSHHLTRGLARRGFESRAELLAIAALADASAHPGRQAGSVGARNHGMSEVVIDGKPKIIAWFAHAAPEVSLLTPAERAVVDAAVLGNSNAEIARQRGASPHTVANQLASAYRKLRVGARWELACVFSDVRRVPKPRAING
jgi:DNA-binding NarL/FixJ family response regulator